MAVFPVMFNKHRDFIGVQPALIGDLPAVVREGALVRDADFASVFIWRIANFWRFREEAAEGQVWLVRLLTANHTGERYQYGRWRGKQKVYLRIELVKQLSGADEEFLEGERVHSGEVFRDDEGFPVAVKRKSFLGKSIADYLREKRQTMGRLMKGNPRGFLPDPLSPGVLFL